MGIYVHIPFCEKKCYYCDFHSVVVSNPEQFAEVIDNYLISVRKEALYYSKHWGDSPLVSLFIGGGTPSILPAEKLGSLIEFLLKELPFVGRPEVTIEVNPNSLDLAGAQILASKGVNRVSIGAQAFQDRLLKSAGRVHIGDQIGETVLNLRKSGINNINLDLMFGLPDQSMSDWVETLEKALTLDITHLSCYGLILEPNTPFATWEAKGLLRLPTDDEQAEMFELSRKILTDLGYEHYEISNFCKPHYQSTHNLLYWRNLSFIGLGSGATGYLNRKRYTNIANIAEYIKVWTNGTPLYQDLHEVTARQEMDETMMVGMRLLRGISERDFIKRYGVSFWDIYSLEIEDLINKRLVEYKNGYLRVTKRGLYLENQVSGAFLP